MHSPAPWAVTDKTKDGHSKVTAAGLSGLVCVVGNGEARPEQATANATLIAAAPTMLAALLHAKANMPHPDQMVDDAIALATP